jgi:hypothetical protein
MHTEQDLYSQIDGDFYDVSFEKTKDELQGASPLLINADISFSPKFEKYISNFCDDTELNTLKRLEINNILKEYNNVYKNVFFKESFISFLLSLDIKEEILNYHPTEKGHELWANNLSKFISSKYEL